MDGLEARAIEDAEQLVGGTQKILIKFRCGLEEYVLGRPPPYLRKILI